MTKTFLAIGFGLLFGLLGVSQSKAQVKRQATSTAIISGTTFDEKHFVNEADLKLWTVTNPRLLKGLAAQYVALTGQIDIRNRTITVESVRRIQPSAVKPRSADYRLLAPQRPIPDYLGPRTSAN